MRAIFSIAMRRRISTTVSLLALCAAHAGDSGAQTDPRLHELLLVRTPAGALPFYVENPDAPTSPARRHNRHLADKTGAVPEPTAGFELTSRVLLRTVPADAAAPLPGLLPHAAQPVPGLPGYWTIDAGSVRAAVALADALATAPAVRDVQLDLAPPRSLRDVPDDPRLPEQWHLINTAQPLFDLNADAAWNAGYTGSGLIIGIVEGAWQHDHPDLAANFNAEASQSGGIVTGHATSCAGLAAAVANNDLMGVGVAFGAQLSNQIYGANLDTALALAYRNDLNDIKSNSWGPPDDANIDYMPAIIRSAIEDGIATGRGGLGEVYVWAGGNGGAVGDRVDYDPYVSSRYTICVGAIGDSDVRASYNEKGSAMLVVAPSSGNVRTIRTTTYNSGWTTSFGGTSAACPQVAGVVALMLQANPALTWRDVQHVLIESARQNDPGHPEWITNGAGYLVNYHYGFGAVDAGAAVATAANWTNVPHEVIADSGVLALNVALPDNDPLGVDQVVAVAANLRVETVELVLNVQTTYVGDLRIVLTGPSGVESVFAEPRSDAQDNYVDYLFTSYRHWGEPAAGDWTVHVADERSGDLATWVDCRLVIYGTPICLGDLDESGAIELADLAALLAAYGACEESPAFVPAADFDNTGCIDLADLAYLLSVYGQSCN